MFFLFEIWKQINAAIAAIAAIAVIAAIAAIAAISAISAIASIALCGSWKKLLKVGNFESLFLRSLLQKIRMILLNAVSTPQ